jgi:hypothetical protein
MVERLSTKACSVRPEALREALNVSSAHRDLRNDAKGHSLNVVQELSLSGRHDGLMSPQQCGVVVSEVEVKTWPSIMKGPLQPFWQPAELGVHLAYSATGLQS